jgi:transposase
MRYMLTDGHWAALGPAVEQSKRYTCGVRPTLPDRMFFEALLYWARTGIPWRDLPAEFGRWDAVYHRFRRWVASGSLAALFHRLTADPVFGDVRRVFIDSTIIRAHPHAAGARRRAKRIGAARSATAQGLGRSRGGFGTKVIVTASDEDTALAVDVVPGQAGDAPRLVPMLARTLRRVPVIDEIVGDKGFDGDALRSACVARDVNPNIPLKRNRDPDRWAWDPEGYKERNRVERLFGKAKQFRRFATRYEKLKVTFLGVAHLALGFVRLRRRSIVNTA